MRILIDMQGAQSESRYRGIGRYSLALVKHLVTLERGQQHEFLLLLNTRLADAADELIKVFRSLLPAGNILMLEPLSGLAWRDTPNHWRALVMEQLREAVIADLQPDVVLLTSLFEGFHDDAITSIGEQPRPLTAVIHYDLIPALNPGYLAEGNPQLFYDRKFQQLKQADLLLSISKSSKQEALDCLKMPEERVVNISAAVGPEFDASVASRRGQRAALSRLGIQEAFLLYVPGGFDARKNFAGLFEAFTLLEEPLRRGLQLVITGFESHESEERLRQVAAGEGVPLEQLVLPGYISDQDLRHLYRSTELFIFPSLHEGFGLPVLEAMTCGAPVIAANNSSLPEVVGDKAALFDPADPKGMSALITRSLTDANFRAKLCELAKKQSSRFSWHTTADLALTALEEIVSRVGSQQPLTDPGAQLPARLAKVLPRPVLAEQIEELAVSLADNFAPATTPQFLLDVTELRIVDSKTGIQRVVRSLLLAFLDAPPPGFEVSAVYFDGKSFRHAREFLTQFAGREGGDDDVVDFSSGDIYVSLDFTVRTTPEAEPLLRVLARRGVRLCFVVYDLLPLLRPDWWPEGMGARYERWLRSLVAVADTILCISEAVARELEEWSRDAGVAPQLAQPQVKWFHLGADIERSAPSRGLPGGYQKLLTALAAAPTFLMVGTLEPRKGHAQVISGFELLWQQGHVVNLLIVGKEGWMVDALMERIDTHALLGKHLFWMSSASDQCLDDLYARSDCLLAASEGEGFGLPLIEGAQRGIPIIARDLPVFREVAGDSAFYFNGLDAEDVSSAICGWLSLRDQGKAPASDVLGWLSWHESAAQLLRALALTRDTAVRGATTQRENT